MAAITRLQAEASRLRILGIDPGSRVTGFAVVDALRSGLAAVRYGEIRPPRDGGLPAVLVEIHDRLGEIIAAGGPDVMAIEAIFFGKNVRSLIQQGHARGVALLGAASCGIPIFEYSPLEVKQAVVGYGRADKRQVQKMVQAILKLAETPPEDAADALAVAICHAHCRKGASL